MGIVEILWGPGSRGQYSGEIRFIEKPGIWRLSTVTGGQILDHGCSPLSLEDHGVSPLLLEDRRRTLVTPHCRYRLDNGP